MPNPCRVPQLSTDPGIPSGWERGLAEFTSEEPPWQTRTPIPERWQALAGTVTELDLRPVASEREHDEAFAPSVPRDPGRVVPAVGSEKAPRKRGGARDITNDTLEGEWRLADLINVCIELKILPQSRADTIGQVLRDYRNFVHPRKELRAAPPAPRLRPISRRGRSGRSLAARRAEV